MSGPRRSFPVTSIQRITLGLIVLMLLIGCDAPSPPASTPITTGSPAPPTPARDNAPTPTARVQEEQSTGTVSSTGATPRLQPTPTSVALASTVPPSLASATATIGQPATTMTAWSPTIPWRGGDRYLLGVNYPYNHYGNDFGGNKWGSYGVHDPTTYAAVDADFAKISSLGVRTARWFVFADGRAGITYDAAGLPSGLDEFVFQDLDAALEIAQRHNIALNLVLLDFRFMWDAQTEKGVQLGGHAAVLATPAGQQALINNVFEPVFRRYANNPAILSWEVMNEPEWGIQDAGSVITEISKPISFATFRAFAKATIDAIHTVARSYATIGSADMKWAQNWLGLGLDYYQIHYYDWMKPYSTDNLFATRAESLHLDRPVVVGEFPADHSRVAGLKDYLDTWYKNGYAGAWAWSFHADTTWGGPDPTILSAWAGAHQSVVNTPAAP